MLLVAWWYIVATKIAWNTGYNLNRALFLGQAHCVRSLISRNANIAHRDASGRTALDLAAFFGDPQVNVWNLHEGF